MPVNMDAGSYDLRKNDFECQKGGKMVTLNAKMGMHNGSECQN